MNASSLKTDCTRVAFGDVVRLSRERAPDPEADGFTRYIGLEHINPDDLTIRRWGNVAEGTTFTNVFRPGQVLFGKRRAYLRKVAVPGFSGNDHLRRAYQSIRGRLSSVTRYRSILLQSLSTCKQAAPRPRSSASILRGRRLKRMA